MAYQEITTAASPADIINAIATFAASNGWTVERNNLVTTNRTVTLKRAETDYIHLWNTSTVEVRVIGSVGYSSAAAPDAQTNSGSEARANVQAGPYTKVFLFAAETPSPHIHVAIETSAGLFRHISFGLLEKVGTYTGGTYYDATNWQLTGVNAHSWSSSSHACFECGAGSYRGAIRADIAADSRVNAWASLNQNLSGATYRGLNGLQSANNNAGSGWLTTFAYNRNSPPFSGNVLLAPIQNFVYRTGDLYSPVGVFPNVRYLTMARFSAGEEISIAGDTWKIFPFVRQGSLGDSTPYSLQHAVAFKKVV